MLQRLASTSAARSSSRLVQPRLASTAALQPPAKAKSFDWTASGIAQFGAAGERAPKLRLAAKGAKKPLPYDPLARVKKALGLPVPKRFPPIRDERLALLLKDSGNSDVSAELAEAYHPELLEFVGDRLLEKIVTECLLVLMPRQRLARGKTPTLKFIESE